MRKVGLLSFGLVQRQTGTLPGIIFPHLRKTCRESRLSTVLGNRYGKDSLSGFRSLSASSDSELKNAMNAVKATNLARKPASGSKRSKQGRGGTGPVNENGVTGVSLSAHKQSKENKACKKIPQDR